MNNDSTSDSSLLNKSQVVSSLHAILKPFLLRRLKVDVEKDLPPKKEYLLYAPLTQQQKDIYQAIVSGQIRQFLVDKKAGHDDVQEVEVVKEEEPEIQLVDRKGKPLNGRRKIRKQARKSYAEEDDDDKYLSDLENEAQNGTAGVQQEQSAANISRAWQIKQASKFLVQFCGSQS